MNRLSMNDMESMLWPEAELEEGLSKGEIFQAILNVNEKNPKEAFARLNGPLVLRSDLEIYKTIYPTSKDVFISTNEERASAFHEDEVLVFVYPRDKWKPCKTVRNDCKCKSDSEPCLLRQPCGKVVGICERKLVRHFCVLDMSTVNSEILIFKPTNIRIPEFAVHKTSSVEAIIQTPDVSQSVFEIQYENWPIKSKYPYGSVIGRVGSLGDFEVEEMMLLTKEQLKEAISEYSPEMLAYCDDMCAKVNKMTATGEFDHRRRDYLHLNIFSIDPPSARDLDDAVHLRLLDPTGSEIDFDALDLIVSTWRQNGGANNEESLLNLLQTIPLGYELEVGIHIADVSYILPTGNPLETCLNQQPCTYYFPHRAIHMLPTALSENILSLNQNGSKIAFSVVLRYNPRTMECVNVDYCRSHIKPRYTLTYQYVQCQIDKAIGCADGPPASADATDKRMSSYTIINPDQQAISFAETMLVTNYEALPHAEDPSFPEYALLNHLLLTHAFTTSLNSKRDRYVSIEKLQIMMDINRDTGRICTVQQYEGMQSQSIVSELMLLANRVVAEILVKEYPDCAILRSHDPPKNKKLDDLWVKLQGKIDSRALDLLKNHDFVGFIYALRVYTEPKIVAMIEQLSINALEPAKYSYRTLMLTQNGDEVYTGHHALQFSAYTHFTSPIRRYADIVAHRQLGHLWDYGKPLNCNRHTLPDTARMTDISSRAKNLSLKAYAVWLYLYIARHKTICSTVGIVWQVLDKRAEFFVNELGSTVNIDYYFLRNNTRLHKCVAESIYNQIEIPTEFDYESDQEQVTFSFASGSTTTLTSMTQVPIYLVPHKEERYKLVALLHPNSSISNAGTTSSDRLASLKKARRNSSKARS